jgi:hypothetical protein
MSHAEEKGYRFQASAVNTCCLDPLELTRSEKHARGMFRRLESFPYRGGLRTARSRALEGGELGEDVTTEYAIKQVGDRYYPVIIDEEAGGHYEIKNPMTGGTLSYNNPEAAEKYIQRARAKEA